MPLLGTAFKLSMNGLHSSGCVSGMLMKASDVIGQGMVLLAFGSTHSPPTARSTTFSQISICSGYCSRLCTADREGHVGADCRDTQTSAPTDGTRLLWEGTASNSMVFSTWTNEIIIQEPCGLNRDVRRFAIKLYSAE